jgi:hypothetical protein
LFYFFLFQIFSSQEKKTKFSIESCRSSALPIGPEHCFLKFLRDNEYVQSIGFYQNGGGSVQEEDPHKIEHKRTFCRQAMVFDDEQNAMQKWSEVVAIYEQCKGRYHYTQKNCCTVALEALLGISASESSQEHVKSANHGIGTGHTK